MEAGDYRSGGAAARSDSDDQAHKQNCRPVGACFWWEIGTIAQAGLRPAPYLASRGMKWIQMTSEETLTTDDLKIYLTESHRLAAKNLTKKRRAELGLAAD